jgi:8-oxo-dGTP pyrophosphatase MutT (NUDIX family)
MTAIRETFEETGILVGSAANQVEGSVLDEARKEIHSRTLPFPKFLIEKSIRVQTESLIPFTQWITPSSAPR